LIDADSNNAVRLLPYKMFCRSVTIFLRKHQFLWTTLWCSSFQW